MAASTSSALGCNMLPGPYMGGDPVPVSYSPSLGGASLALGGTAQMAMAVGGPQSKGAAGSHIHGVLPPSSLHQQALKHGHLGSSSRVVQGQVAPPAPPSPTHDVLQACDAGSRSMPRMRRKGQRDSSESTAEMQRGRARWVAGWHST